MRKNNETKREVRVTRKEGKVGLRGYEEGGKRGIEGMRGEGVMGQHPFGSSQRGN